VSGGFRLAGVMGWPVGHSRSPVLHGHWLRRYGIAGAYVPLPVRPKDLGAALRGLPVLGFAGCNLTVPHKEAALEFMDHVDPTAQRLGSANTVIVRPDGTLEGRSTDGYGFMANLRASAPLWDPTAGSALVIGAGGAARAIAGALADAGAPEIRIVNRTDERARALARDLGDPLVPWDWSRRASAIADCTLVVNTTTQGMAGQPPLDLDLALLRPDAMVADIVYTPLQTPLLTAAPTFPDNARDLRWSAAVLIRAQRPGAEISGAWPCDSPPLTDLPSGLWTATNRRRAAHPRRPASHAPTRSARPARSRRRTRRPA